MNILFLGPQCTRIDNFLLSAGHQLLRIEDKITLINIKSLKPDFGLSYRYQHMLNEDIINFFAGKLINMHISLLPWNRGRDPNFWSFMDNTPKGVTIHRIDSGTDTGPILLQKELFFDNNEETLRTSYMKLSETIEDLFIENAQDLLLSRVNLKPQENGGSYHRGVDKLPYMYLLDKLGWDTPVRELKYPAPQD